MEDLEYKYETLYHYLKNRILNGSYRYGDKIQPETVLAQRFSMSRFTVRRAIELLTNEGFLEKRHGSGTYVKTVNPGGKRSGVVGIVTTYLDDYIFPSIIRGMETVLTQHNMTMSLGITENNLEKETSCLRSMLAQNIDGLIIEGTKSALVNPNIGLLEIFRQRGVPVVFINGNYSDFNSSFVLMDDERSGQMVAGFLVGKGHRRIGGILKSDDIQGRRRFRGIANALHEKNIEITEKSFLWYTTEDIERIFKQDYDHLLIQRFQECTALICYNDQIAVRTVKTLERSGKRIPDDISIISFDNSELCEVSPVRLTSVTHARNTMGEKAAELLLDLMAKSDVSGSVTKILLPSALVVRDSVIDLGDNCI